MLSKIKEHHDSALCLDAGFNYQIRWATWSLIMKSAELCLLGGYVYHDSINVHRANKSHRLYFEDAITVLGHVYDELLHV
jgi:hypothetical protein